MDPYRQSQNYDQDDRSDPNAPPLMKPPKRKRLAKACDACHKSKRRCDGTAPCSNCFYAAKACSYTDASGRPVPAPRLSEVGPGLRNSQSTASSSSHNPATQIQAEYGEEDHRNIHNRPHPQSSNPRKRFRNDRGNAVPTEDISAPLPLPMMGGSMPVALDRPDPVELDHALTRELTNLFFTHCHPARAIVHKPTFSASLAHNRVPLHLLYAVCALAAPLSKQPKLRTSPPRFAGKRFAEEALSIMFDGAGRLVCERNLETAQALCILQIHDVSTKDKNMFWNSRYHADLALQIVESLNVYHPEHPTLTPVPSPEFIHASIEREAVRRIFWLIHLLDVMASIYFKKPMVGLGEQGMRLRLPADETSFELGVHSTLPEYLYLPAVRTQYSSEFGHLIRVISIYTKVEFALDELSDPSPDSVMNPAATLEDAEQMLEAWASSLSEHLRFSEQNLQVQQSMFETSSNTGAWCWCCMHIYHASTALALNLVRKQPHRSANPEPQWAVQVIDMIMTMLGDRVKNSILLGAALWSMIKFCRRDDQQIRTWLAEYEGHWGTRMQDLVSEWRPHQSPPIQHHYLPSTQPHQYPPTTQQPHTSLYPQHQQASHRRIAEVRNPNAPSPGARPPSHQHDSSYNRRSPGSASPTPFPLGRSLDDLRLHTTSNNHKNRHLHPDRDEGLRGHTGPSPGNLGQGQGSTAENVEREKENGGNMENGDARGAGSNSGDGPHSLPSLKGIGLLDSWSLGEGANAHKQTVHGLNGTQRHSPTRLSPPHAQEVENRSTTLVTSMPVGLQWLANEPR